MMERQAESQADAGPRPGSGPLHPVLGDDAARAAARIGAAADALEGRTVLVSGGAGFLGSAMVDVLLHLNRTRFSRPARALIVDNFVTGVPSRVQQMAADPQVLDARWALDPAAWAEPSEYLPIGVMA